jgi:hypothetical protein
MPRYYFNLRGDIDADDPEGTELADDDAAREFAVESARELVCADIKQGWLNLDHCIVVVEKDRLVTMVTFRNAFELKSRNPDQGSA